MHDCKHLSVALDVDGGLGLKLVQIEDIIFFECDGIINRIVVHTRDASYYTMGTLRFYVELLNNSGFNFKLVDRNNAVNIHNIAYLDKGTKKAYFEWPLGPNAKCCTFSAKHFDSVVRGLPAGKAILGY
ncbi:LytTR family DNA-binding domain-containing protein [Paenibacillus daejeonensis]|uniref:LytTR family DNA-binding domain-containing protein n=1 Tax=Paenibacillus daejeonensis TaxID=135193 RepID=UPI0003810B58|nr:LytTR family DNA-binding domain-containing protein [Paenibacillus daejeonensis]